MGAPGMIARLVTIIVRTLAAITNDATFRLALFR